jgi:hypothetical protein
LKTETLENKPKPAKIAQVTIKTRIEQSASKQEISVPPIKPLLPHALTAAEKKILAKSIKQYEAQLAQKIEMMYPDTYN